MTVAESQAAAAQTTETEAPATPAPARQRPTSVDTQTEDASARVTAETPTPPLTRKRRPTNRPSRRPKRRPPRRRLDAAAEEGLRRRRASRPPMRRRPTRLRPAGSDSESMTMAELLDDSDNEVKKLKHGDVEGTDVRIGTPTRSSSTSVARARLVAARHRDRRGAPRRHSGRDRGPQRGAPRPSAGVAGRPASSLRRAGLEQRWCRRRLLRRPDRRGPCHRSQQGWPHRRPRRPRLRADQPDRRLPAPPSATSSHAMPPRRSPRSSSRSSAARCG